MPIIDPFDEKPAGIIDPFDDAGPKVSAFEFPPMAPIEMESASPPSAREMKPYVRAAAQVAAGLPVGIAASPIAGGAAAALAGIAVDAAYGDMSEPKDYAAEAGIMAALPVAGGVVAKYGVGYIKAGLNKAAKRIYQSGAKFLPSLAPEARDSITTTALQNKFLPHSQKSLDELGSTINAIDHAMEGAFRAQDSIRGIPTSGVKESYSRMINYYRENNIFGPEVADQLSNKLKYLNELPAYINPRRALEIRRNMNKDLRGFFKHYNTAGATPAEGASTQALASMRGELNNSLYEFFPELKELGKRESSYIILQEHIERAMNRLNNRELLPLSAIIAGSAVGGIAGGVSGDWKTGGGSGLGAAMAIALVGSPNMKARVAFALARAGGLSRATPSTLQLLNLTRVKATTLESQMKALPFPRTMKSGKEDPSGIDKSGQIDRLWKKYADDNALDVSGKPLGPIEKTPPAPESGMELGEYGRALNPMPEVGQGGVAFSPTGNYDYPLGRHGELLQPTAFAGVLPQNATRAVPLPGSRNMIWQAYGNKGSNPAYIMTDEEFLRAMSIKQKPGVKVKKK